jgi:uncharacterized RDD family membrane protein YckC
MGKYIPGPWKGTTRRTIAEVLDEAEEQHFLDCPNADYLQRVAALILDTIFLFLICSAVQKLTYVLIDMFHGSATPVSNSTIALLLSIKTAIQVFFWYCSQIWWVARFGASPAKLILGLRIIDSQTGGNLSLPRVFLREVLLKMGLFVATAGLICLRPLIRRDHLTFHDSVSGSVVKKTRPS